MKTSALLMMAIAITIVGCSSQPIMPDAKNIEIKREDPSGKCENLGPAEGRSSNQGSGNTAAAIEDLKKEAALKGGNYVRMETTSALGNSVRGTVFRCQ